MGTEKKCLGCDLPLSNGECHTPACIYNANDQNEYAHVHVEGEESPSDGPRYEQLRDHGLPPAPRNEGMQDFDKRNREKGEVPEQRHQEGDEEDDSGLPPRPHGCEGECKPTDNPGPDDVPCPHCTAKRYRDQIRDDRDRDDTKYVAKDLDRVQERRFDEVVRRLKEFSEKSFGDQAEDIWLAAKQQSRESGEDVSQTLQITSNDAMTYFITVAAVSGIWDGKFELVENRYRSGDMEASQEARYDEVFRRTYDHISETFGNLKHNMGSNIRQQGDFAGEDINQRIIVNSNDETIYTITVAAMSGLD